MCYRAGMKISTAPLCDAKQRRGKFAATVTTGQFYRFGA
jgi:hypothetical protein